MRLPKLAQFYGNMMLTEQKGVKKQNTEPINSYGG